MFDGNNTNENGLEDAVFADQQYSDAAANLDYELGDLFKDLEPVDLSGNEALVVISSDQEFGPTRNVVVASEDPTTAMISSVSLDTIPETEPTTAMLTFDADVVQQFEPGELQLEDSEEPDETDKRKDTALFGGALVLAVTVCVLLVLAFTRQSTAVENPELAAAPTTEATQPNSSPFDTATTVGDTQTPESSTALLTQPEAVSATPATTLSQRVTTTTRATTTLSSATTVKQPTTASSAPTTTTPPTTTAAPTTTVAPTTTTPPTTAPPLSFSNSAYVLSSDNSNVGSTYSVETSLCVTEWSLSVVDSNGTEIAQSTTPVPASPCEKEWAVSVSTSNLTSGQTYSATVSASFTTGVAGTSTVTLTAP